MNVTLKPYARLAAMGAYAVSAGALGLYLLIGVASRPTAHGGIDATHAMLTWISLAVPIAALVAAHVVYARILLRYAKE